jgi:hypothetical protein
LSHDSQKLSFERFLRLDACFEINELFGHVLARRFLLRDVGGELLDLVECDTKLIRGHSDH